MSQNYWGLLRPFGAMSPNPAAQAGTTYSCSHRAMPRMLLIMSKEGVSTNSPGNLWRCLVTLTATKCFLMLKQSLFCLSWLLSSHRAPLKRARVHPLSSLTSGIYIYIYLYWPDLSPSLPFSRLKSPSSQPFLIAEDLCWSLSSICPHLSCSGEPRTGTTTPGVVSPVMR